MILLDGDFRLWLQTGLQIGLFLAALRWGAGPERILALVLVWFRVADLVNHALFEQARAGFTVAHGHVLIDVVAAAVALAVALFANRIYALWFAALQLLAVLAHVAHQLAPGVELLAYRLLYVGPSYFQIILLAGGIWYHRRRVRRHGPYRSWRSSSPPSRAPQPGSWPSA